MNEQEFVEEVARARALFESGDYVNSLALLDALTVEFPESRRVAYARALCLLGLRRFDESEAVCIALRGRYLDRREEKVLAKIRELRRPAAAIESSSPDSSPPESSPPEIHFPPAAEDPPAAQRKSSRPKTQAAPPIPRPTRSRRPIVWAAAFVIVAAAVGAAFFVVPNRKPAAAENPPAASSKMSSDPTLRQYENAATRLSFDYPPAWTLQEEAQATSPSPFPALGSCLLSSETSVPKVPSISRETEAQTGEAAKPAAKSTVNWNLAGLVLRISAVSLSDDGAAGVTSELVREFEEIASGAKRKGRGPGLRDTLDGGEVVAHPDFFDLHGLMGARFTMEGKMADGNPMVLRETDLFDPGGMSVMMTAYYPKSRESEFEPILKKIVESITIRPATKGR